MARRGFTEQKSLLEIVSFVYSIVGVRIVDLMDVKLLTEIEPGLGVNATQEVLQEFMNKVFVSKLRKWCNAGVFQMDFFNEGRTEKERNRIFSRSSLCHADDSTLKAERNRIEEMPAGADKVAATNALLYEAKHGRILTERAGQTHSVYFV